MRAEQEPAFMHRATERTALRENAAFDPRACTTCSEPVSNCSCPSDAPAPQPFRIRVEKLTPSGIIGEWLGQTFFAVDAMTARRNAMTVFGHLREGWMWLAVPVRS